MSSQEIHDTLDAWPACPRCRKRRVAMCPFCKTTGIDFPLADENFSLAGEPIPPAKHQGLVQIDMSMLDEPDEGPAHIFAVICPICDEPFAPEFYRRCEWCDHDFGNGKIMEPTPRLRFDDDSPPLVPDMRNILIATGLLAGLGALVAWLFF